MAGAQPPNRMHLCLEGCRQGWRAEGRAGAREGGRPRLMASLLPGPGSALLHYGSPLPSLHLPLPPSPLHLPPSLTPTSLHCWLCCPGFPSLGLSVSFPESHSPRCRLGQGSGLPTGRPDPERERWAWGPPLTTRILGEMCVDDPTEDSRAVNSWQQRPNQSCGSMVTSLPLTHPSSHECLVEPRLSLQGQEAGGIPSSETVSFLTFPRLAWLTAGAESDDGWGAEGGGIESLCM